MRTKVLREHFEELYQNLSESMDQISKTYHFNDLELRDGELYYKGKGLPLKVRGVKLRLVGVIAEILSKEGLCELGFDIPKSSKVTA